MDLSLDPIEIRTLGALIEKQITTPEYYPLTLNALINACNQTTNREPVTAYDETAVARALDHLRELGLIWVVTNSRAHKYGTPFSEKLALDRPQTAVLCVLMLRGPQTTGEIRGRTGRLHAFGSLEEVEQVLETLARAERPRAAKQPRAPGTKEARFAHLLGRGLGRDGATTPAESPPIDRIATVSGETVAESARVVELEADVEALRQELAKLRRQFLELSERLG